MQGSKGIRQWPINLYIPNNGTQNYHYCRLQLVVDTQINEATKQNPIKVPKVVKHIRNRYYKTLGTSVIKSPRSPPFLIGMISIIRCQYIKGFLGRCETTRETKVYLLSWRTKLLLFVFDKK